MGEDCWVYVSKKSLKEMLKNADFDYLLWLMREVEGQRWHRVLEKLGFELFSDVPKNEILTSKTILRHLALNDKKIAWRTPMVDICENYEIVLWGDFSEKKFEDPNYIPLYRLREKFEEIIKHMVEE
jgi:hypothetical protein